jgi:hypothetical protein
MPDAADPLSPQAERVLAGCMVAGLLMLLELGLGVLGAPALMLLWPALIVAAAAIAVRHDIGHVRRHGWWKPGGETGGSDSDRPGPPGPGDPSGDAERFEWERFQSEFWEHVDAQRSSPAR